MSDTSLCKYSNRVFIGILDNYPKGSFPMNYDTVAYYNEIRDNVVSILNEQFIAKIKRTLKEWPTCSANGGTVNIVFENGAGYFKCDKCEPEYNAKPSHKFDTKLIKSTIKHFQGFGVEETFNIRMDQIMAGWQ